MRRKITKALKGRATTNRKEVALRINRSGLSAKGLPRYVLAVRFTDESYKKASRTEYVGVEIDDELSRMYFVSSDNIEGYKLSASGKSSKYKSISFSIDNVDEWSDKVGDYDLLKDNNEQLYYIEFAKR